jgi:hypothetical protein
MGRIIAAAVRKLPTPTTEVAKDGDFSKIVRPVVILVGHPLLDNVRILTREPTPFGRAIYMTKGI